MFEDLNTIIEEILNQNSIDYEYDKTRDLFLARYSVFSFADSIEQVIYRCGNHLLFETTCGAVDRCCLDQVAVQVLDRNSNLIMGSYDLYRIEGLVRFRTTILLTGKTPDEREIGEHMELGFSSALDFSKNILMSKRLLERDPMYR